ncbi:MAG: COG4315 family predicted lipoprotein [Solirubrobacteraceae bacterium]
MKRILLSLTLTAVAAVPFVTEASARSRGHSRTTTVQLRRTSLGKILVDGGGFTLYMFTRDRRNQDVCLRIKGCTSVWIPLRSTGATIAGRGVSARMLSSIRLPHGARQVTYGGDTLYTYTGDTRPGETSYVGQPQFGGTWPALTAADRAVTGSGGY